MSVGAELPPSAVLGRAQQACVARLDSQPSSSRAVGITTDYEEGEWVVVVRCREGEPPEILRTYSGRLPKTHDGHVRTRDTYKYPLYIGIGVGAFVISALYLASHKADAPQHTTNGLHFNLLHIAR